MDQTEHINYWVISAEHDFETALTLYDNEKYDWCLYLGHLVIEKILKAHFVKHNNDVSPRTHNLSLLATKTNIPLADDLLNKLDKINTYNLEAR